MNIQDKIRKLIAEERKKRAVTYAAFAREAGCTDRAISYWENGQRTPRDIETIERVLHNLGYRLVIVSDDGELK